MSSITPTESAEWTAVPTTPIAPEVPPRVAWNRVAEYYGIAFGFACLLGLGLWLAGANLISGAAAPVFTYALACLYMPLPIVAGLIALARCTGRVADIAAALVGEVGVVGAYLHGPRGDQDALVGHVLARVAEADHDTTGRTVDDGRHHSRASANGEWVELSQVTTAHETQETSCPRVIRWARPRTSPDESTISCHNSQLSYPSSSRSRRSPRRATRSQLTRIF